ncbi:dihydrodipicolinate synthase family protein [Octadecabacter sp. 1_MG-2023]|uniref:dihydrodipicolinate synthase family protein n=1 Tax=unclassified Octadecabacter TaxID=196158 RepID=UPI001C0963D3|nr:MULTISPECIES: dihydrodipicolinate synthase family protein [unclassified Octadecabacter]MBU2991720.1 dihydrodipicolinate synthase family protein [Octadecabacter sp. B2R22]MDO6735693.1 dihydrodipicolinate synthase family protein [Octadecabacter sp. 1_MG-2023]
MTKARRGIYAAAVSPFQPDGSLNHAKLVDYCTHLLSDGGCDGVAPTGTTGEGTSVGMADRLALPAAFAKANIETDRVIFGTGAPSLLDAVALTRAACDAGYTNALVLPPYYYKSPSDEGLFAYYAKLIELVGRDDLRVYLYHFPQMSQVPLSVDLVLKLRAEFGPIIAGLKDSSGDFEQSRAFIDATGGIDQDFDVYPSSEAFLWDGLSIGSAGIISGSTNIFANKVQDARQASEGPARDTKMDAVRKARAVAGKYPLMAAMKTAEAWRSGDDSWLQMQPPLLPLTADQKANLKADLASLSSS